MKKQDRDKLRILKSLSDNRKRILNIEICRSSHVPNKWNIRIGDMIGSTELSNVKLEEILKEIRDEMNNLDENNE